MNTTVKLTTLAAALVVALGSAPAHASHFRGGAMIPTVSASGLLTVNTTSFWRPSATDSVSPTVGGLGFMSSIAGPTPDTSDARFTKISQTHTIQLPTAGLYTITGSSCCRVSGIRNFAGSSSTSWALTSKILWNGSSAATPILFSFSAVQPEVVRGSAYSGNLGATSLNGFTLSYDQTLNPPIASQPPGFTIDPNTGALSIPAASTAGYLDNLSNAGADYSFSGNIFATSGTAPMGQVEFEWLFDAVNTGSQNLAPQVTDAIVNALVGSTVNHTFAATDDGNPNPPGTLSWLPTLNFTPGCGGAASWNNLTQAFSWSSAGCSPGTYVAQVTATDGALTDVGLLTINLNNNGVPPTGIPEPASIALLGLGLSAAAWMRRRRS